MPSSKRNNLTKKCDVSASLSNESHKCGIYKDLKTKANHFLNSHRKTNYLVEIVDCLNNSSLKKNDANALPTLLVIEVIFKQLLKRGDLQSKNAESNSVDVVLMEYSNGLRKIYEDVMNLILSHIHDDNIKVSEQALIVYMKLLVSESENPIVKQQSNLFPILRLSNLIKKLLSTEKDLTNVINKFQKFSEYLDIVYHSWKCLQLLGSKESFKNSIFARNYLEMINVLNITDDLYKHNNILCKLATNENCKLTEYAELRKIVNKVWKSIMEWSDKAEESVHRRLLITLLERIMKHLNAPVMLTDYLVDSLNCGGPISLLALQGIYWLIQKHNIIYPNIYNKLYSMFEPDIFYMKYKSRFFYLADIFLTSTHLPECLVVAFVKRLARLCLIAPTQDIIIILKFINNLIVRFVGLKRLICAETETAVTMKNDPFIMEECDPLQSHAMESQLWEILLLQKHAVPNVAKLAKQISQTIPKTEYDLAEDLSTTDDDLFNAEISQKANVYALALAAPNTKFSLTEQEFDENAYVDLF